VSAFIEGGKQMLRRGGEGERGGSLLRPFKTERERCQSWWKGKADFALARGGERGEGTNSASVSERGEKKINFC